MYKLFLITVNFISTFWYVAAKTKQFANALFVRTTYQSQFWVLTYSLWNARARVHFCRWWLFRGL